MKEVLKIQRFHINKTVSTSDEGITTKEGKSSLLANNMEVS